MSRSAAEARPPIAPEELRQLDQHHWYKPLDVGEAGLAASVNASGRLLVVTQGHPVHGQVQLTAAPELPAAVRYEQQAVRDFRRRLSAPDAPSFGVGPEGTSGGREVAAAWLWHEAIPVTQLVASRLASPEPGLVTLVPHPDDVGGAQGVVQIRLTQASAAPPYRWRGRMRLARAPYPQLTEGGPLPPAPSQLRVDTAPGVVMLSDPALGWHVAIGGDFKPPTAAVAIGEDGWCVLDLPLCTNWTATVIGLGREAEEAAGACEALRATSPDALLTSAARRWSQRWQAWPAGSNRLDHIARRGLAYALSCCVVPVDDAACLITDHRLLPLAWTRDGYFVARAFLDWTMQTGVPEPAAVVRRHLRWLFETAARPEGWWARSHLTWGQRKDNAFQADQQLYPLLELADYTRTTGDGEPLGRYAEQLPIVLAALDARADPATGLLGTEETSADEPAGLPYQAATQILAWRTYTQLARLGVAPRALEERAERLRQAIYRHLVITAAGSRVFAYAADARGTSVHYHDANDLPLALAAQWGFCAPDDPIWRSTLETVFAPTHDGYISGRYGGLGSVHTPAPWPLGHLQQLIAGDQRGDGLATGIERSLLAEAQWDGLLPEASNENDGSPASRPWFAWPGAVAASHYLATRAGISP